MRFNHLIEKVPFPASLVPRRGIEKRETRERDQKDTKSGSRDKKKVLIVEDEALVAESLREVMDRAGYEVVAMLSTGEEALQTISGGGGVDVILMDVRLAGELTGIETMNLIHKTRQIPVVFLTAYTEDLFPQVSSISQSLYRYISKPYDEQEIELRIRELLG